MTTESVEHVLNEIAEIRSALAEIGEYEPAGMLVRLVDLVQEGRGTSMTAMAVSSQTIDSIREWVLKTVASNMIRELETALRKEGK